MTGEPNVSFVVAVASYRDNWRGGRMSLDMLRRVAPNAEVAEAMGRIWAEKNRPGAQYLVLVTPDRLASAMSAGTAETPSAQGRSPASATGEAGDAQ